MARRRGWGDGTVIERRPGRWQLQVWTQDPETGERRRVGRSVRTAKRGGKREALAELRDLQREAGLPVVAEPDTTTFAEVAEDWLRILKREGRAPSTLETYRSYLRNHLIPALGEVPVEDVRARTLDRLYWALVEDKGLAASTVETIHAVALGVLHQAKRWELIESVPEPRPPRPVETDKTALLPSQVASLVAGARERNLNELAFAIELGARTGMRRGELCGLKVTDVAGDPPRIAVERQLDDHGRVRPPKGGRPRTVALGPQTAEIIETYLAKRKRAYGDRGDWLISHDGGVTPIHPPRLTEALSRLGRALKIPVSPHDLRRFHQTYQVAGGVDIVTAARRAGHTPEVLLRDYARRVTAMDVAAAVAIEDVLAETS